MCGSPATSLARVRAVERQEEACRSLCASRGWSVAEVVVDNDTSASSGKRRPGWERVLQMIDQGRIEVLVGWHVDRLLRSMADLEHLIDLTNRQGVPVVTASGDLDLSTDAGRLVARILGSVARGEVERKSARQVLQNQQRVSRGRLRWSHRPFGYEKDGTPREPEATALREAYQAILRGERVFTIRDAWNQAGLLTNQGNRWQTQAVGKLLRDPRNYGGLRYRGEVVGRGEWEPLISEEVWSAVQTRLGEKATGGNAPATDSMLVGVARCGVCGGKIWTNRSSQQETSYVCPKGHLGLPVDWAEGQVLARIAGFLGDPTYREQWQAWVQARAGEQAEANQELALLEERLEALAEDYAEGLLTRAAMLKATARVREKIETLTSTMGPVADENRWSFDVEYLYAEVDAMTPDERREWLRSVTEEILLHRRGRGKRGLWPELVEVRPKSLN